VYKCWSLLNIYVFDLCKWSYRHIFVLIYIYFLQFASISISNHNVFSPFRKKHHVINIRLNCKMNLCGWIFCSVYKHLNVIPNERYASITISAKQASQLTKISKLSWSSNILNTSKITKRLKIFFKQLWWFK
jgi:hypothetical protein